MKKITLMIAALVTVTASQSQAVFDPTWDRPVAKAEMKILQAQGYLAPVQNAEITMTRRDGPHRMPGFIVSLDGKILNFKVVKSQKDACGSMVYTAIVPLDARNIQKTLTLVSHTGHICRDLRPFIWEATITFKALNSYRPLQTASLTLGGNPEPLYTIASVHPTNLSHDLEQTVSEIGVTDLIDSEQSEGIEFEQPYISF